MTKENIETILKKKPTWIYMKVKSHSKKPLFDGVIRKYMLTKQSIVYDKQNNEFVAQVDRGSYAECHSNSMIICLDPDKHNETWSLEKTKIKRKKIYFANLLKKKAQLLLFEDGVYDLVCKEYSKGRTSKISNVSKLAYVHKYCQENNGILKIYNEEGKEITYVEAVDILNSW